MEVKSFARSAGADLAGIAPAERFRDLPPDSNPLSIFPECRSVIVLGRRILRGSLRGVEEGTNFNSTYGHFGYHWLEDNFLSRTTYETTCRIESLGFEAVPLFGYSPDGMPQGAPVTPGKPAPNVILDPEFAAWAAGLGQPGFGRFFLTPKYGPRQRFAMILTDAGLAPDPVLEGRPCEDCDKACARACPLGAIDAGRTEPAPGSGASLAQVDYDVCRACMNGAMTGPGRGTRPDRCAAACARACVVRLEISGKLEQKFENPFRKRAPWALDAFRRPLAR